MNLKALYFSTLPIYAVIFNLHGSYCVDFHRETSGVVFGAYVKKRRDGEDTSWESYSLNDIKIMTQVISTRFSRIATYGVGAPNREYKPNFTYYKNGAQVYSGEAAGLVNKERNNRTLSILIGVWTSPMSQQMETEMLVALESVRKSNQIYENTVEGIVISGFNASSDNDIKYTLQNIKFLKDRAKREGLHLRLGTRQSCYGISKDNVNRFRLFNESDFVICEMDASPNNVESRGKTAFSTVGDDLLAFRKDFRKLNPNVEVMGQILWSSKGKLSYQSITNQKEYWLEGDRWGYQHNFTIWMEEAFDQPGKLYEAANLGWWWLKDNSLVGSMKGYGEKIFDPPPQDSTPLSKWAIVGITSGVLLFLFLTFLVFYLLYCRRVNKHQDALTKEEIREFMYGIPDGQSAQRVESVLITETAFKIPYDNSYELVKDQIKFSDNVLLGSGAFGCVYKALIDGDEKKEVALKTIKKDCPATALKGLLSEIRILIYLGKHPNIVSIIGSYTSELKSGIVYVATELCTLGSLESVLRKETTNTSIPTDIRYSKAPINPDYCDQMNATTFIEVTIKDMTRWSHEIACGMEYLGTKHVVHADLATRNVLLGSDRTAKITDFGLSRRLYDYTNYVKQQQEPLPWRWMSIEALKRLEFSSMSDVWSYGVTLWEIYSMGDLPYPGLSWNLDFVDDVSNGLRMKSPPHASQEIYKIMVDCWQLDPKQRPTFTALKMLTGTILESNPTSDAPWAKILNELHNRPKI